MLVSCVIPAFNGERFLGDAIDSILAQTHRALEIILVDDGSTDGTAGIAARYGERVRCIRQEHRGPAAARNAGVRAVRGDLVAFLDADDLWEPGKLAAQLERLGHEPAIDLCFTRLQNFWDAELDEEARRYAGHAIAQPSAAWSICTLLARRQVFGRYGPFDEALVGNENMTWFLHAARRGARIEVLPLVAMRRRLHRGNLTRAAESLNLDRFFPILKAWRDCARPAGDRRGSGADRES